MKKRALIVLAILIVAALAAVLALPALLDLDRYREAIEGQAEAAVGRDVELGKLGVSWRPFGIRVDDLAIPAGAGEDGPPLRVRSLRVGARLLPLLRKRLEVTTVLLERPELTLERGADGTFRVAGIAPPTATAAATGDPASNSTDGSAAAISVDDLRLTNGTIRVRDGGRDLLTFSPVNLTVTDVAPDRETSVTLDLSLAELPKSRLQLTGRVGPFDGSAPTRLHGRLTATALDLGRLTVLTGNREAMPAAGAAAPFTAGIDVDLSRDATSGRIEITALTIDLEGRRATLTGTVTPAGDGHDLDLELKPAELGAADLTALARLAGVPVTLASADPVELHGTVKGRLDEKHRPAVYGSARVRGLRIAHPDLAKPIDRVDAAVELNDQHIEVNDLAVTVGKSDFAGSVTIDGTERPKVAFDLRSTRVDFAEMTAMVADEPLPAGAKPTPIPLTANGKIHVDTGTFDRLAFTDLDATMRVEHGIFRLDPVTMKVYGGGFSGTVLQSLVSPDADFELRGRADKVDLGQLLEASLGEKPIVSGTLSGQLTASGRGLELKDILQSLAGDGEAAVVDGRTGLDLIGPLTRVKGVFGDQTLSALEDVASSAGTPFQRLGGTVRIADGKALLREVALTSRAFDLAGEADVNLLADTIDGRFVVRFSEAVSDEMRSRQTQAAEVFWNPKLSRVELPFTLTGPTAAPHAGVDWTGAAKQVAVNKISGLFGRATGGGEAGTASNVGAQSPIGGTTAGGKGPGGATTRAAANLARKATADGLTVEIDGATWSGRIIKGLEIVGTARGAVDHVTVSVEDQNGISLQTVDRADGKASGGSYAFKAKIDGKRLALGKPPFVVKARAVDKSGRGPTAGLAVER